MRTRHDVACEMSAFVIKWFSFLLPSLTLLGGIILIGLTLPLPDIAINIIKIVSRDVANAIEMEEVGLRRDSPEQQEKAPRRHREQADVKRSKRH